MGILLTIVFGVIGFYNIKQKENLILENVFIDGVDVGGLTKEEAVKRIEENRFFGDLTLISENQHFNYTLEEFGCEVKTEDAVGKAFQVGRGEALLDNIGAFYMHNYFNKAEMLELDYFIPEDISTKISEELEPKFNKPSNDAKISINGRINITKESKGTKLDTEALKSSIDEAIVSNEDVVIEIPIKTVEPKITYNMLSQIDGEIGSYRTTYTENQLGRNENIRLSASRINDTLLMPGEEFSYNQQTGFKTEKNGYKPATVIVNGEIEEGIGGGVCQVSSTLFNSVLYAGLDITQRRPHSIPSNYVDYGRDAVVSDNAIDFKFINNYDFPVFIKAYTDKNSVTVKIYGNQAKVKKIDIYSKVVGKTERTVKYVEDPTLPKGQEKIKDKGRDEIISETYKIENGTHTRIARDKYPMKPKVILVGTKES